MIRRLASATAVTAAVIIVLGLTPGASAEDVPAPHPDSVRDGGLIWNGGFDVADYAGHPLGWSVEGNEAGVNVVNRSAFRTGGLTSLQIKDDASSAITVRSKRAVAVPGTEYSLRCDVKGEGATGTAPRFTVEFWGMPLMPAQQGPLLDSKSVAPEYSTDWQHVELAATAPSGTVQVSVVIATGLAEAGTAHVDSLELAGAAPAYDPRVGSGRELFVDDYRIESMVDVGRVVHPATKDPEPLIVADRPWEKTVYYGSVVRPVGSDEYQLFYTCYNDVAPYYHMCLAESRDFIHWTKPILGVYEWKGSTRNNIVSAPGGSVAYNPDAPEDSRYSLLYFKSSPFGYHGQTSADGIHWKDVSAEPLLPGGDVVSLTYDTVSRRYIATFKDRLFQSDTPGTYDRSAFIATSTDFRTWTPRTLAVSGDVADDGVAYAEGGVEGQIYGMPVVRYGNQYVAFPWNFSITDFTTGQYAAAGDGPIAPGIAASRDLRHWTRAARGPVLRPGAPGAWNDGALYTSNYLKVNDKTVELLYGGFNTWHGGAVPGTTQEASIGRAVWRRDGFVSVSNGAAGGLGDPGTLTTKPLIFMGDTLHVNVRTHRGGSVRVEVLDAATGSPVAGLAARQAVTLTGDHTDAAVHWVGARGLGSVSGRQVKLRFHLTGADLYAYWFTG